MGKRIGFIKGIRYRNAFVYNFLMLLKYRNNQNLRYKIVAEYIKPGDSVIDFCSGDGGLKKLLPYGCSYAGIEASPEFAAVLSKKNIKCHMVNLHNGLSISNLESDICVMLISLCQFRSTSVDSLLDSLKTVARRVVILEKVAKKKVSEESFIYRMNHYLCATDYYIMVQEFTTEEFKKIMERHGYKSKEYPGGYVTGCYNKV